MDINKILGFSFYAVCMDQVNDEMCRLFGKAEAALFSREDLQRDRWNKAWENIKKICDKLGSENVSFHFPMNDCSLIDDDFVFERLLESGEKVNELNIKKIILHSNCQTELSKWSLIKMNKMKKAVIEKLKIINWPNVKLCLENMPPIGNLCDDADVLFVFVSDFDEIIRNNIGITWDINHYFNTVATMKNAEEDMALKSSLPRFQTCDYFDFESILSKIDHWHFSAFKTIANPITNKTCIEGCTVKECEDVPESIFRQALKAIIADSMCNQKSIILEIAERNYTNRNNIYKMREWINENAK